MYTHIPVYVVYIAGFIPKELFEDKDLGQLRTISCQRCYFLERHDTALNVRVSPQVYEKLLEPIKDKRALVVVVVDLLDVPCSIWPNIIDIVGKFTLFVISTLAAKLCCC